MECDPAFMIQWVVDGDTARRSRSYISRWSGFLRSHSRSGWPPWRWIWSFRCTCWSSRSDRAGTRSSDISATADRRWHRTWRSGTCCSSSRCIPGWSSRFPGSASSLESTEFARWPRRECWCLRASPVRAAGSLCSSPGASRPWTARFCTKFDPKWASNI